MGNISSILGNLSNSSSIISVINKSLSKLNITNISEELSNGMNISNIGRSVEHDVNSVLNISGISLVPSASWMRGYTLSPGQSVTISYTGKLYLDPNIPEINGVNYGRTFAVPIVGNLYEFVVLTQGGPVSYNVTASQ